MQKPLIIIINQDTSLNNALPLLQNYDLIISLYILDTFNNDISIINLLDNFSLTL
jgi:hypothetical protein